VDFPSVFKEVKATTAERWIEFEEPKIIQIPEILSIETNVE